MNNEKMKKMLDDDYDVTREAPLRSMIKEFYSRKMLFIAVLVWIWGIIFFVGAVYSAIRFYKNGQILDAIIFLCCLQLVSLAKIFAWVMVTKNSIQREIKRLELRIAELTENLKNK